MLRLTSTCEEFTLVHSPLRSWQPRTTGRNRIVLDTGIWVFGLRKQRAIGLSCNLLASRFASV
jgi:hypothetical protein